MAIQRFTKDYTVTVDANDGYVNHDTTTFNNSANSLLIGSSSDEDFDSYMSFLNIEIPKNSTITNAILKFNIFAVYDGYVTTEFRANTLYNIPTDYESFTGMTGTTNYISFYQDEEDDEQYVSYTATDIIQELINRDDWVSGNIITFFTGNTTAETIDSYVDIDSREYNPIVELSITWEYDIPPTLSEVLLGNRIESFEYELLNTSANGLIHKSYITDYVKSADIKIDFSRNIIGNASFEINDEADINYVSDLIKVHYNVSNPDVEYTIPLGVFKMDSPTRKSDSMVIHRNVQAFDLLYMLEQDKTTVATSYPSGTNVIDAIKTLLDSVGSWVRYSIEDNSETLSEDMTYQLGRSKLYIINGLLNAINYYPLWATGNGVFKSIPWSISKNTTWEFKDDITSLYSKGIDVNLDYSESYNKVIIVTNETTEDTAPLTATLTFEDLGIEDDVPFSYTNLGYYKTKVFNSEAVSQDYVDLRAERELYKMLELNEIIDFSHAFVTARENDGLPYQGDHYYFKNELLEIDEYYKIENMSYKLKTGEMVKSSIRRVRNV